MNTEHSRNHGEAFCHMLYRSDDGTETESIWNSRDGVTPFTITLLSGKQATHVNWHTDLYHPDYVPRVGERIFVDLHPERAVQMATRQVEKWWDDPGFPMSKAYSSREEAIERLSESYLQPGAPDLVEVTLFLREQFQKV